ncbi:CidA/LrgA family protein [Janibacter limosus]|uniref:CidA/LrgA family protein n=1 Tax=Janibacter limosus TaxID=53458 RepID=A0A4P6MR87_9MICO|nr:CidA/LrgA family protein [Janibacter limosus]QBF45519.1 CidA/LrgA family protein [Janibacter limosus]
MGFVNGLLWLLGCQLVGEVISHALGLPIPGSVIGMVLLFGVLLVRKPEVDSGTLGAADGLLRHLQLLFIPAGVGVMVSFGELRADWLPIGGGLVLSWCIGLAVVAGLTTWVLRRQDPAR